MVKFLGTDFFSLSHFLLKCSQNTRMELQYVCKPMDDNWIQIYASKKIFLAKTMQRIYT